MKAIYKIEVNDCHTPEQIRDELRKIYYIRDCELLDPPSGPYRYFISYVFQKSDGTEGYCSHSLDLDSRIKCMDDVLVAQEIIEADRGDRISILNLIEFED